jgi:hypothetical protein
VRPTSTTRDLRQRYRKLRQRRVRDDNYTGFLLTYHHRFQRRTVKWVDSVRQTGVQTRRLQIVHPATGVQTRQGQIVHHSTWCTNSSPSNCPPSNWCTSSSGSNCPPLNWCTNSSSSNCTPAYYCVLASLIKSQRLPNWCATHCSPSIHLPATTPARLQHDYCLLAIGVQTQRCQIVHPAAGVQTQGRQIVHHLIGVQTHRRQIVHPPAWCTNSGPPNCTPPHWCTNSSRSNCTPYTTTTALHQHT